MNKKEYLSPNINIYTTSTSMAVPLAFFSAATAAAAVVGTVAGAAAAAKVMGDDRSLNYKGLSNREVKGLIV